MRKDEKKGIILGVFIIICCLFISFFISLYLIIPKDKLSTKVKDYYINYGINYFKDSDNISITIDSLIKKGYAKKQKEFENYLCNYKLSYLIKENNSIKFILNCKKYTKNYIVVVPKGA